MPAQRRDGTAAIRDGVLVVTPPAPGARPAVLRGSPGVKIAHGNGGPDTGPVEVVAAGDVRISLPPDEPRLVARVEVAADELTADLVVERLPGVRYRLEDQPPNHEVVLRRVPSDRTPCPVPTVDALMGVLQDHGVPEALDLDALSRLAAPGPPR